ncbi:hypothetical protein BMS3Bbin02_00746 [bacterium BMS3Bbin02]|nr:hypothetical protein BMS3Bbin02_00746 [bacterium BMS3Bbin02]
MAAEPRLDLFRLVGRQVPGHDKTIEIEVAYGGVIVDNSIHLRLRERRFISLVVAESPVSNQIDDDITLERLTERKRHLCYSCYRFGVIPVDMEDWRFDGLGNVSGIVTRSGIASCRRKSDLVVDDDVYGSAGGVTMKL